jgi:hypothetical protein
MKTEHSNWDCQIWIIWIAMLLFFIYFIIQTITQFYSYSISRQKMANVMEL